MRQDNRTRQELEKELLMMQTSSTMSDDDWQPVDLGPVLAGDFHIDPPSVLSRDDGVPLFYPYRLNDLVGEPEALKTWLAKWAEAQEIKLGHHVVFIDYEDCEKGAVERLLSLGLTRDDIRHHFTYIRSPQPILSDKATGILSELIDKKGDVTLAIFDGVTAALGMAGLDPNDGTDVTAFYNAAPRWFADRGAAVVLLDHVTKDRAGRGRWAIGSERKVSGIDGAAYVLKVLKRLGRGGTGRVKVIVAKDRPGYVRQHEGQEHAIATFVLSSGEDGTLEASLLPPDQAGEDGEFRPTALMEKVSKVLEDAEGPRSQRQVRSLTTGKTQFVTQALERLVTEGYVERKQGRGKSLSYSLIKPFQAGASQPLPFLGEEDEDEDDDLCVHTEELEPVRSGSPYKKGGTRNQADRLVPGTIGNHLGTGPTKKVQPDKKSQQDDKEEDGRGAKAPSTVDYGPTSKQLAKGKATKMVSPGRGAPRRPGTLPGRPGTKAPGALPRVPSLAGRRPQDSAPPTSQGR